MVKQRCDCTEEGSSVLSLLVQAKTNISVQEPTHIQSVYINSLLSFCSFSVLSLTRTQSLFIQALTHTHTHRRYLYDLSHTYGARAFFFFTIAADISTIQNYIRHLYAFISSRHYIKYNRLFLLLLFYFYNFYNFKV